MSEFIQASTDSQIVKAYTCIMLTSDIRMSILMAQIPVESGTTDLGIIAAAIRDWCLVGVKSLEDSSVEENLEDRLSITDVDDDDTPEALVKAFHQAIRWNTPVK